MSFADSIVNAGRCLMRGDAESWAVTQMNAWPWAGQGVGQIGSCSVWMQGQRNAEGAASEDEKNRPASANDPQSYHRPVLPAEVVEYLQPGPGKIVLDATLGGGGHSELLLEAGAQVVALDQDAEALEHARERLRGHAPRFSAFHGNFRNFPALLEEMGMGPLDGILADLGVSSRQLDSAARGFSFSQDGPLDMRMNQQAGRSAADVVNESDVTELEHILREYGEERQARRIARAIVARRATRPFATTGDLAALIAGVVPRHGKTHPATQSFQAIRIAVNEELAALADFLAHIPRWLKPGGRAVLISFQSAEDRMVKQAFARGAAEWLDRPEWPEPRRNPEHCLRLLTRKPVEATDAEVKSNPRARSAKLRAAERILS
jgi:16S rRNA (cytosine1402-N4)-methyltransferase